MPVKHLAWASAAALFGVSFLSAAAGAQDGPLKEIGPDNIDLRGGGAGARADWIRYKLVEVNGPTGGYVLNRRHGNPAGYVGTINELTGAGALGALLAERGITRCADIPTSGDASLTVAGRGQFSAWFGLGNLALPEHFRQGGARFERHLVLADDGERTLEVQLSCGAGTSLVSGYFWLTGSRAGDRVKEVYFQRDEATGLSRVEVYMTHPASTERYAFRFETETGEIVRIWSVRVLDAGSKAGESSAFAVVYRPATGLALARFSHPGDPTGDEICIDMNANAAASGCESSGLAFAEPAPSPRVGGETHPFTMEGLVAMRVRLGAPDLPIPGVIQQGQDAGVMVSSIDAGAPRRLDAGFPQTQDGGVGDAAVDAGGSASASSE